ncbi:hypothetical protein K6X12_13185 [Xanthomonas euvesicatoria pv. allii]|uniref:hypothetical protein n=1 Tax=Xanthomonas euvesicatoria TaxID=456327 RepID=UPI002406634E|nr:hypothetical protein [Xanthomonas euvesicatoria]MCP3052016.1 hypothetical protein [Xanthomonas euvesicatoria pv. allii]
MKVVAAANAMISNPKLITSVIPGRLGNEIFFLYDGKYKWSVLTSGNDCSLFFYPGSAELAYMAAWDEDQWQDLNEHIRYSAKELGTKEALETFTELYRVVQERRYDIDDVLEDIIGKSGWA